VSDVDYHLSPYFFSLLYVFLTYIYNVLLLSLLLSLDLTSKLAWAGLVRFAG